MGGQTAPAGMIGWRHTCADSSPIRPNTQPPLTLPAAGQIKQNGSYLKPHGKWPEPAKAAHSILHPCSDNSKYF